VPRRLWLAAGIAGLALAGTVGAWHLTQDTGSDTAAAPVPVESGPDRAGLQPVSANAAAAPRVALPSAAAGERTVGANGLRSSAAGPAVPSTAAAPDAPAPRKAKDRTLRSADATEAGASARDDARGADRPQPAAARSDEPPPRVRRGTATAPARDPASHEGAAGSPRDACGSRVFLSLALCMEEQCEKPRFKAHPQCSPVREIMERRRRGQTG
jgi:hypothetical protein